MWEIVENKKEEEESKDERGWTTVSATSQHATSLAAQPPSHENSFPLSLPSMDNSSSLQPISSHVQKASRRPPPPAPQLHLLDDPGAWEVKCTREGRPYFVCSSLGVSSWAMPPCLQALDAPPISLSQINVEYTTSKK